MPFCDDAHFIKIGYKVGKNNMFYKCVIRVGT